MSSFSQPLQYMILCLTNIQTTKYLCMWYQFQKIDWKILCLNFKIIIQIHIFSKAGMRSQNTYVNSSVSGIFV